ncbi:MAG: hypothetical protein ACR2NG_05315 [Acidimicrobiia bacterium]
MLEDHLSWRRRVGEQVCASYAESAKVAATALGGSVARGWADEFSDLEVFVFWRESPTRDDRSSAVVRSGGSIDVFMADTDARNRRKAALAATEGKAGFLWPYEDDEWSEHFCVDDLSIGVSGFAVATVDTWIDNLRRGVSTDISEMVASTLIARAWITGSTILDDWREQLDPYPDALAKTIINRWLQPDQMWWSVDVLASRNDRPALDAVLVGMQQRLFRLLLAVNGQYLVDPRPKWTQQLIGRCEHLPRDCAARLEQAQLSPPATAAALLQELFEDVLETISQRFPTIDVQQAKVLYRLRR